MTDRELLKAIDDHDEDCSSWEAEFVDSCLGRLKDEGAALSPKQRAKAEEILAALNERSGR